jgi:hypothetical protein
VLSYTFNISKAMGVKLDNKHWCDHVPKPVETGHKGKVTILWIQKVRTDRTIPNNKPYTVIRDNKKGTSILIDVCTSWEDLYKDLIIEILGIWNVKAKVIPVKRGATGTISK